jgi:hypothetical protein
LWILWGINVTTSAMTSSVSCRTNVNRSSRSLITCNYIAGSRMCCIRQIVFYRIPTLHNYSCQQWLELCTFWINNFFVLHAVTTRSLIDCYQRLGGSYRFHIQCYPEDGGDTFIRNVCNNIKDYASLQLRRTQPTSWLPWEPQIPELYINFIIQWVTSFMKKQTKEGAEKEMMWEKGRK